MPAPSPSTSKASPRPPPLDLPKSYTRSFVPGRMTISSQTSQESSVRGKVKCTPLQGAEYLARCAGATPAPKYNNLEEWFQDVSVVYHFCERPNFTVFGRILCPFITMLTKELFVFHRIPNRRSLVKRKTSRWSGPSTPIDPMREAT